MGRCAHLAFVCIPRADRRAPDFALAMVVAGRGEKARMALDRGNRSGASAHDMAAFPARGKTRGSWPGKQRAARRLLGSQSLTVLAVIARQDQWPVDLPCVKRRARRSGETSPPRPNFWTRQRQPVTIGRPGSTLPRPSNNCPPVALSPADRLQLDSDLPVSTGSVSAFFRP